ncbi:MAG: hypothetical protein ABSH19_06775 [Opitutales bacterium]|jgi:hypothetical protein
MNNSTKFFQDNLQRLGPTPRHQVEKDPEKYNLYSGLLSMSEEIAALRAETKKLHDAVSHLSTQV